MKLIIDIKDFDYKCCKENKVTLNLFEELVSAVSNGTIKAENTVSEEIYTQEYLARKDAELKLYKIERIINAPIGGTSAKYNAIVNLIRYSEVDNGNED